MVLRSLACSKVGKECDGGDDRVGINVDDITEKQSRRATWAATERLRNVGMDCVTSQRLQEMQKRSVLQSDCGYRTYYMPTLRVVCVRSWFCDLCRTGVEDVSFAE